MCTFFTGYEPRHSIYDVVIRYKDPRQEPFQQVTSPAIFIYYVVSKYAKALVSVVRDNETPRAPFQQVTSLAISCTT